MRGRRRGLAEERPYLRPSLETRLIRWTVGTVIDDRRADLRYPAFPRLGAPFERPTPPVPSKPRSFPGSQIAP